MKQSHLISIKNFFGFGHNEVANLSQRRTYLRISVNIALPVTLVFAIFNYLNGFTWLASVEALTTIGLLSPTYFLSRQDKFVSFAEYLVLAYALIVTAALVVYGGIEGTGVLWIFAFPFLAFLLKGQRIGWYVCIIWLVTMHIAFTRAPYFNYSYSYSEVFSQQIYAAMFFFSLIAAAFNLVRSQFEVLLDKQVKLNTKKAESYLDELQYLALHDTETGLPNRTNVLETLDDKLKNCEKNQTKIIVVMLHLERFTEISNILGEDGGKQLMVFLSKRLQEALSPKGFLAHDRQNEFIYFFETQEQVSEQTVYQHVGDLLLTFKIDDFHIHIEYTMGAAAYPNHAESAEDLLNKSEQALLQAISSDLPLAVYDDALRNHFVRRHLLFGKLKQALSNQELTLFYQAKVDMNSKKIIGVEALARWIDANGNFIKPDDFIPVAENSGLIKPFTEWVIREAFGQLARWYEQDIKIKMSINLSIRNIIDPDLIPLLKTMLEKHKLPPDSVVLEITESSFSDSRDQILETVGVLSSIGFKQSIDDFGTGYSSLSYLKDLRVNELKIDQSFVRNLLTDAHSRAIVTSIIQIAHNLGLSVVAEGIEDHETEKWLTEAGSDIGQGYLFTKPMPNKDFIEHFWKQV